MSENELKSCQSSEYCSNLKCKLDTIKYYLEKPCSTQCWVGYIVSFITVAIIITCICYCWKTHREAAQQHSPAYQQKDSKQKLQCDTNSIDTNINFKNKLGDSSFNLSLQGKQNPYNNSECFWLVIGFLIFGVLIYLFKLIARSARENRLLQFAVELNEQAKEIKLKEIAKENKK